MTLRKGQLCLFDMENKLNIRESGTVTVKVLSKKRRLLRKSIYTVTSLQNGNIFEVTEDLLCPIYKEDTEDQHILLRYPDDVPVITSNDVKTVDDLINLTQENSDINIRLKMLKIKLDYFSKIGDV